MRLDRFPAAAALFLLFASPSAPQEGPRVEKALDIAPVWAGHPVSFCLLTAGGRQYAAYYDAERRMTVAARALDSEKWEHRVLPSRAGWDSHNYITMAVDAGGHLHLSGNMHCVPLLYFRTAKPRDIGSFEAVPQMVGSHEKQCTYPRFMTGPKGDLVFHYRDGRSGSGREIYNTYDLGSKAWRRLLDVPLIDGGGEMNTYAVGPVRGPDGAYHLCWVWRDSPDCATNHDLSYARSEDLVRWETAAGRAVGLPLKIETEGLIVDPVPPGQGLINMGVALGFDARSRPVISYHKYDGNGNSQVYNARWEGDAWRITQASDWDYRWSFGGGGSVACEVRGGPVRALPDGSLEQPYGHVKFGSGTWKLDPGTLKPVGKARVPASRPPELARPESVFPGMQVNWASDLGESGDPDVVYMLRWETLGVNRDRARPGPLPAPGPLRLYAIRRGVGAADFQRPSGARGISPW
jgi:hypothetical protein